MCACVAAENRKKKKDWAETAQLEKKEESFRRAPGESGRMGRRERIA